MADSIAEPEISVGIIHELLELKAGEFQELEAIYSRLPDTRCERKAHCCSMLPEATLLETLAVFEKLGRMPEEQRQGIFSKIIEYFFINPAQVTACPFLEKRRCTIYENRFFGCRAYGLWSQQHYERMAHYNRQAKRSLRQQWFRLGIALPEVVADFQVPYCLDVAVVNGAEPDDRALKQMAVGIEALSSRLLPWHRTYNQQYFADLSFLTAATAYGVRPVLKMKVDIVRELVTTANRTQLDKILMNIKYNALPCGA